MKKRFQSLILVFVTAFLTSSCTSTRLTSSWMERQAGIPPIRSVTVVPVMHDQAFNLFFEKKLIQELEKHGVDARGSSIQVLPEGNRDIGRDVIDSLISAGSSETVLITRFVTATQQEVFVPAFRSLHTTYTDGYPIRRDPVDMTSVNTYFYYKTSIYGTSDGQLLWAGMTRTWNPDSYEQIMEEVIQTLVEELSGAGLIPHNPE